MVLGWKVSDPVIEGDSTMARATGSGVISFGLVSVPVKLYSTVDTTKQIRFNNLRKSDGSRLKQQYIAATDGKLVEKEERIKGYEFAKGQYVMFTDEEIKAMDSIATNEIKIEEFVPADQISATYVEKVNFLGPDLGANKSYHLLAEAMRRTQKCALAKYSARGKSYLVMIQPIDGGLEMVQLRHSEEMRFFEDVKVPPAEINDAELDLAIQLVEQVSSDEFHPENYTDEIRQRTLEMIEQKVNGEDIVVSMDSHPESKVIDIMDALKASLKNQSALKAKPKRAAKKNKKKAIVKKIPKRAAND
jgi:DNA end-binding protein Ku